MGRGLLVSQLLQSTSSPSAFPHFTSAHMAKCSGAFRLRKPEEGKLQSRLTPVLVTSQQREIWGKSTRTGHSIQCRLLVRLEKEGEKMPIRQETKQIKSKLSIWLHRNWSAMLWLKIVPQRAEGALASNQLPPAKLFRTTEVCQDHQKKQLSITICCSDQKSTYWQDYTQTERDQLLRCKPKHWLYLISRMLMLPVATHQPTLWDFLFSKTPSLERQHHSDQHKSQSINQNDKKLNTSTHSPHVSSWFLCMLWNSHTRGS